MTFRMMATLLGAVFAALVRRYSPNRATLLGAGMVFGVVVWLVMQYGIWPLVDSTRPPGAAGTEPAR